MGCDGGTIPRRDELVRLKKKPEAKDKDSELVFQWRHCAITQQVLQEPIVMCGLGKLYNKVSLIEALLHKETMPPSGMHIRNLKDIKNLNLTPNPTFQDGDKKDGAGDARGAPWICPVIGLETSGKFRFVALWTCGCVFSERALKEIATKNCHKCQKPFEDNDVVILNGNENDLVLMKTRMELRLKLHKKNRENKKKIEVKVEVLENLPSTSTASSSTDPHTSKTVKPEQERQQAPLPNLINAGKRSGSLKAAAHDSKKMKSDYSVAEDPQVTNVYKSIFTSHESEKTQNRAHWVTYNPFYN